MGQLGQRWVNVMGQSGGSDDLQALEHPTNLTPNY